MVTPTSSVCHTADSSYWETVFLDVCFSSHDSESQLIGRDLEEHYVIDTKQNLTYDVSFLEKRVFAQVRLSAWNDIVSTPGQADHTCVV